MKRIVVVGNSGSGKTTVSRRLASALDLPLLELDAVFHQPGWTPLPNEQFRAAMSEFTEAEEWVVDGNYTSQGVREIVWPRADTVVWLDLTKWAIMSRIVRRTLRRVVTREELWNQNREPLANIYHPDPEKNIIRWAWTRFGHVREKYERCIADGTWDHIRVVRLRTPDEVDRFVSSVTESAQ